jgi:pimeloyl-ACP methyl ester carboxylesterase
MEFVSCGVRLRGTLTLPDGDGPWPGLATVHGATGSLRDFRLFVHLERLLVPAGFAILRYDRRGSGDSEGDFASADFRLLGADAAAALAALAAEPGLDSSRLGLFGFSQGGWICPEAATQTDLVRFMVLVGACGVTPADQMSFAAELQLRGVGFDESVIRHALTVRRLVDDGTRGAADRDEVVAALRSARTEAWFDGAFLPMPTEWSPEPAGSKWALEMDYDVRPALRALGMPVLLIHGDHDRWVPIDESERVWREAFGGRSDQLSTARIPGTGHFPTLARGQEGEDLAPFSPDYEALVLRWLRSLPA